MEIKVLGSSSKGNCYILENENEALIIEAGVRFSSVKKALEYNVGKIVGCIITHEHKDHSGHVQEYLDSAIQVYMSQGTLDNLCPLIRGRRYPRACDTNRVLRLGGFSIIPFDAKHDAAQPLGFYIHHEDCGNLLFATDTYYLPCTFSGLDNVVLECNYDHTILNRNIENGYVSASMRKRLLQSHMSLSQCVNTLLANDLTKVRNIVLIHLSDKNSSEELFVKTVSYATHKNVLCADKNTVINLDKCTF